MNTIRSRGIMLNTLVRDCPVFMVLLWAILNATLVLTRAYICHSLDMSAKSIPEQTKDP